MKRTQGAQADTIDGDILRRLDRAVRTGGLVRVHRAIPRADRFEGFVVGVDAGWTLIARCTDIRLDGWTAVRTADIVKVRRRGDGNCLTIRALRRRGRWPVRMPEPAVRLDTLPALAESASAAFGLITLHVERHMPDVCYIGALTELRRASLRLREVDTEARWRDGVSAFRFKDITRVEFGGHYEKTLREFAGPRP
ncbi:hypothetical protein [Streptomyces lavendofoliae]|uniref:Uncharacterized protein n=1 Tax=Streptomyces lavendofoliae TaxID=67314 RepID=A0A918HZ93_9ACTN|nr:hypothetical protein [Streptomyces lavendofoliae]GGU49246.1 hypothetical protein GCM10010274_42200 [Streptomyces lavendofoliae]